MQNKWQTIGLGQLITKLGVILSVLFVHITLRANRFLPIALFVLLFWYAKTVSSKQLKKVRYIVTDLKNDRFMLENWQFACKRIVGYWPCHDGESIFLLYTSLNPTFLFKINVVCDRVQPHSLRRGLPVGPGHGDHQETRAKLKHNLHPPKQSSTSSSCLSHCLQVSLL